MYYKIHVYINTIALSLVHSQRRYRRIAIENDDIVVSYIALVCTNARGTIRTVRTRTGTT